MDNTVPPPTIADEYVAFDQSKMYKAESKQEKMNSFEVHFYARLKVSAVNIICNFK